MDILKNLFRSLVLFSEAYDCRWTLQKWLIYILIGHGSGWREGCVHIRTRSRDDSKGLLIYIDKVRNIIQLNLSAGSTREFECAASSGIRSV